MTRPGPPGTGDAAIALAPPLLQGSLLVACSGGLDSTVLLHLLASDPGARGRGLRAIHVNHGLHADAGAWATHCRRTCRDLGVALDVVEVSVERDGGEGLEAAARTARHAAFAAALEAGGILVLAHHQDDQAETFLLRALRAAGPDGRGAMRPWRRFALGWMWRPLLACPRERLLRHARAHGLRWIEDPSNASDTHERNFLRNQVMPLLQSRWPHAAAALAQSACLQQDASALLAGADAQALATLRTADPRCLRVEPLAALVPARRARVLRRWVDELGLPPLPARGLERIEPLLANGDRDRGEVAWHGAVLTRWRDLLHAGLRSAPTDTRPAPWDGRAPLHWGGSELALCPPLAPDEGFDAEPGASGPPFMVQPRQGGERIVLPGRAHSHALKHVLQDLGVPPWVRARLPLLCDRAGTLLAAGDLALSARFDAWLRRTGRRLWWRAAD